jgi:SAM-dependent methyltransferase
LPFQDGTFDHVWSYAVTMNIADKEGLGREVARVLKPGRALLMQRDRARVRRSSSVSVALGDRRGDEFPCETRGNARRS